MSLEEEMINRAGKELADSIDWGFLADLYLDIGWEEVHVSNYTDKYRNGMAAWIFTNIKGNKTGRAGRWLFENGKDATWFRLMWA